MFTTSTWTNLGKALYAGFTLMTPEQAANTIPGYAASQVTEPTYPTSDQMDAAFKKSGTSAEALQKAADWASDAQDDLADGFSKVASKAKDANDAVDRAINALARHTEQAKADALAVGLGDAALAAYRATASETAAKQANGNEETAKQAAQFAALKVQAEAAADALAKAKVASDMGSWFSVDRRFAGRRGNCEPTEGNIRKRYPGRVSL